MEMAWCSVCHKSVSLAHAVAERPCPECGAMRYLMVVGNSERDTLLSEAERMMRIGMWTSALAALDRCHDNGLISDAGYNLEKITLDWRKACAASASKALQDSGGGMMADDLRALLLEEYDEYVVRWLFHDYQGFCMLKT